MSEYIDKAKLYNKLREREGVIQKRVDETPATINGALSPCYTRYSAQLNEVTRCRELVADFPTENEWIPVSERLPEEREWIGTKQFGTTISDEVYVTFEIPNGGRFCDHVRFQNGKLSPAERAKVNAIAKNAEPIAWMPLPGPYEQKEEIREVR